MRKSGGADGRHSSQDAFSARQSGATANYQFERQQRLGGDDLAGNSGQHVLGRNAAKILSRQAYRCETWIDRLGDFEVIDPANRKITRDVQAHALSF